MLDMEVCVEERDELEKLGVSVSRCLYCGWFRIVVDGMGLLV